MAEYLYKKLRGDPANSSMNLQNFEYHEPFVARKSTDQKQMMHTEATLRSDSNTVFFRWYNVETDHWYASAAITFENSDAWMADWSRITHLITSRIDYLQEAAANGRASKLSPTFSLPTLRQPSRLVRNLQRNANSHSGPNGGIC